MNTSHERKKTGTMNWITPKWISSGLNITFDLDPCSCDPQPWPCAKVSYSKVEDGYSKDWFGMVWLNPPYGVETYRWVNKLKEHGSGIALIFVRTDTKLWQDVILPHASGIFFIKRRVRFCTPLGVESNEAGSASALVSFGYSCSHVLENSSLSGRFVRLQNE